jgi:hypothetical protein
MKYYRLAKGEEIKYVSIPSESWLPLAEYVCFHPDYDGSQDGLLDLYDDITDSEDDPEWFFEELPEVQYDTCVEVSQDEYRKQTGGIEKACYYYRNDNEPYYEGELPESWYEEAQTELLPVSYWCDQFGYEDDMCKVLEDFINNFNMFETMVGMMQGVDPELEVEAYDRWIYAHALESMGKTELISYRK